MKRQADLQVSLSTNEDLWQEDEDDDEDEVELIELDSQTQNIDGAFDADGETGPMDGLEEAAWIEVMKEGRWKTDKPSASPKTTRKREKAKTEKSQGHKQKVNGKERADTAGEGSESSSEGSDSDVDDEEEKGPAQEEDFERIWTTRIERPDSTSLGSDPESYQPHSGPEEGEESIGRYRRQQDTLIVWKSAAGETELALSFAATAGCAEVWEFLKIVHKKWELGYLKSKEHEEDVEAEHAALFYTGPGGSNGSSDSSGTGGLGGYGLGIGPLAHSQALLPDPNLGNLVELDKTVKFVGRTQLGREKLSTLVLRMVSYKVRNQSFH